MPIHRSTTGNEKKTTSGMQFQTGQVVYTILWNDDLNLSNCYYFQTRCPFACFASYSSRPTLLVMQPPPPRPTHSAGSSQRLETPKTSAGSHSSRPTLDSLQKLLPALLSVFFLFSFCQSPLSLISLRLYKRSVTFRSVSSAPIQIAGPIS